MRNEGDRLIAKLDLPESVIFMHDEFCEYKWESCALYIFPKAVHAMRVKDDRFGFVACFLEELRAALPKCACGCGQHGDERCYFCDTPRKFWSCLHKIETPSAARKCSKEEKFQKACFKCAYFMYRNHERENLEAVSSLYKECCCYYPRVIAAFDKLDFPTNVKEIIWQYL